jgi:hypothetical protein
MGAGRDPAGWNQDSRRAVDAVPGGTPRSPVSWVDVMDDLRPIHSLLTAGLAAVLVVACGSASPASPTSPASVAPASAAPAMSAEASPLFHPVGASLDGRMLLLGRPGEPDLQAVVAGSNEIAMTVPFGAADADWGRIVSVARKGDGTEVHEVDVSSGASGQPLQVDGAWRLPTIGTDALPVGRSANGSVVVLVPASDAPYGTGSMSRFLVLKEGAQLGWTVGRTIELKGSFDFDALSPDGSILYVVQHLDAGPGGRYQVRSVDVATGSMDDAPIVDKTTPAEPMAGSPLTQLRRANGFVLTAYRGPEHPFIHLLSSGEKWAICIDLPSTGASDAAAAKDWGLVEAPDGHSIFAVNASLGLVADLDLNDLTVRRTGRITGPTAAADGAGAAAEGPVIVLAKFGHDSGGSIGSRAVVTSDGTTLVAGGRDGLAGIATKDLSTSWRALPGASVRSLAMSPDGQVAFALLATGKVTAVSVADGAVIGDVGTGGYDRLVGVAG